jgi:regulatory protein
VAALRLLGRRDYSRAEITSRLLARGYAPEDVDAAVARLAEEGAIDDHRAAAAHVRTAARLKQRGRLRIRRELEARGIPKAIAADALAALPAEDDLAAIRRLIARKPLPPDASPAERRRLFSQLLRRGFEAGAIAKALKWRDDE